MDFLKMGLEPLHRLKHAVLRLLYAGRGRECPICGGRFRRFRSFGVVPRADVRCPGCDSLERHRLVWLFLHGKTALFDGRPRRVLHVAPEECFLPRFRRRLGPGYVTGDLNNPRADRRLDVTDIDAADGAFDVIYCSHVLEHVPDDRRAMRELRRVLRPGGWALFLVPIREGTKTHEDPAIVDPVERTRAFGQHDHVRMYGSDFVDRLTAAGFRVTVYRLEDVCDAATAARLRLSPNDPLYFCAT